MLTSNWLKTLFGIVLLMTLAGCGGGGSPESISGPIGGDGGSTANSATLNWGPPILNVDGTTITDLAGYKVYYGDSSGYYTTVVDVGNVTNYTVQNLSPGAYFFVITAYDVSGNQSDYSNEVQVTLQ